MPIKLILVAFLSLVFGGFGKAQISFNGPVSGQVNSPVFVTIDLPDGAKPVITHTGIDERDKDNIRYLKTLDDKPILFIQLTRPTRISFAAAIWHEQKLSVAIYTVEIRNGNTPLPVPPAPKPPEPMPPASQLAQDIKAAYLVNPDDALRQDLIIAYTQVRDNIPKYSSLAVAAVALREKAAPNGLSAVKKVVQDHLNKNVTSLESLHTALSSAIIALEALK